MNTLLMYYWIFFCVIKLWESWCLSILLINHGSQQVNESLAGTWKTVAQRALSASSPLTCSRPQEGEKKKKKSNKRLCNHAGYFYWKCAFIITLPVKKKTTSLSRNRTTGTFPNKTKAIKELHLGVVQACLNWQRESVECEKTAKITRNYKAACEGAGSYMVSDSGVELEKSCLDEGNERTMG